MVNGGLSVLARGSCGLIVSIGLEWALAKHVRRWLRNQLAEAAEVMPSGEQKTAEAESSELVSEAAERVFVSRQNRIEAGSQGSTQTASALGCAK